MHPSCVAERKKAEEEKKKKKEEEEAAKETAEVPCKCPNCKACGKIKKKQDMDKWWSMSVPGKEGAVVGMVCVIL